jgi:hypothetical protein
MHATSAESTYDHQEQINMIFTNHSKEDIIYPLAVKEIAQVQKDNAVLKKLHNHDKYSTQLIEDTQLFCKNGKMVTLTVLQTEQLADITTTCSFLDTPSQRGLARSDVLEKYGYKGENGSQKT